MDELKTSSSRSFENKANGNYLAEFVYGATDGTITTFAIMAGAVGASLDSGVILVLGFANLLADGFSMAVSNYLSTKSQRDLDKDLGNPKRPLKTAFATFFSFVLIGFIPLLSFTFAFLSSFLEENKFKVSVILTSLAFIMIGSVKGAATGKNKTFSSFETLLIGGVAATIAFVVGYLLRETAS